MTTDHQTQTAALFNDTSQYADIIDRPQPVAKWHLPMPQADRAAQFAPFAALTGYHELIGQRAAIYAHKHYPTKQAKQRVVAQLKAVTALPAMPQLNIDYFNDAVGYYQTATSQLCRLDWKRGRVYFTTIASIAMANIRSVSIANPKDK
ncbi:hypothetical protein [Lactiplantibacillus paraplantarum]|uniref:Uncharacterized protein n=1 Tax=Lactiplantibacillus paraplantarum TaxID=60520 RepID=A0A2I9CW56_9LACO|nr:hypothetical protein [Lactiplantibacillus paraplantarum]AVW11249.1 hypothetical protein DA077_12175 [Lactiplantibacillus paraplantarum]AYJ39663.1 hypothetical protein LP667_13055 [Lactiplantibacillus paraplantarum]ERL45698.1 hypothetical protein N644_0195 [Lactiplantibacillus paraplantarum]KRL50692.1 hypothetical protein FD48_GL002245 [Lactiplantibacillus paraplantarum DSM 10667]MDL2062084.1 hypothetical protein [Lactiplantibacillus paraplantarum]